MKHISFLGKLINALFNKVIPNNTSMFILFSFLYFDLNGSQTLHRLIPFKTPYIILLMWSLFCSTLEQFYSFYIPLHYMHESTLLHSTANKSMRLFCFICSAGNSIIPWIRIKLPLRLLPFTNILFMTVNIINPINIFRIYLTHYRTIVLYFLIPMQRQYRTFKTYIYFTISVDNT